MVEPDTSQTPPELPWQWEIQKEMNNQLGRLATLVGLLVTAAALTIASEPFKPLWTQGIGHELNSGTLANPNLAVFVNLALLGGTLIATGIQFIDPMGLVVPPPLLLNVPLEVDWETELTQRAESIIVIAQLAAAAMMGLAACWGALAATAAGTSVLVPWAMAFVQFILAVLSWRKPARRKWLYQ